MRFYFAKIIKKSRVIPDAYLRETKETKMCSAEMPIPECLIHPTPITEKMWRGGQLKHITLTEKTDLIYAIRVWDESLRRWIFMEMQKLAPFHFTMENGDDTHLLCKRYARFCLYTSTAQSMKFSFHGGDIFRLLGDSCHKPTELDVFAWEACMNGFLLRGSIPQNWKSSDMAYVCSLLK